jgi:hypothetical protein
MSALNAFTLIRLFLVASFLPHSTQTDHQILLFQLLLISGLFGKPIKSWLSTVALASFLTLLFLKEVSGRVTFALGPDPQTVLNK